MIILSHDGHHKKHLQGECLKRYDHDKNTFYQGECLKCGMMTMRFRNFTATPALTGPQEFLLGPPNYGEAPQKSLVYNI